jgi:hypothetical protein
MAAMKRVAPNHSQMYLFLPDLMGFLFRFLLTKSFPGLFRPALKTIMAFLTPNPGIPDGPIVPLHLSGISKTNTL